MASQYYNPGKTIDIRPFWGEMGVDSGIMKPSPLPSTASVVYVRARGKLCSCYPIYDISSGLLSLIGSHTSWFIGLDAILCALYAETILLLTCPIRARKSHTVTMGPCPAKLEITISRNTSAPPYHLLSVPVLADSWLLEARPSSLKEPCPTVRFILPPAAVGCTLGVSIIVHASMTYRFSSHCAMVAVVVVVN